MPGPNGEINLLSSINAGDNKAKSVRKNGAVSMREALNRFYTSQTEIDRAAKSANSLVKVLFTSTREANKAVKAAEKAIKKECFTFDKERNKNIKFSKKVVKEAQDSMDFGY